MNKIKVHVRMFDGTAFWANVYLKEGDRLQDLMNDDRKFIPMEKITEKQGAVDNLLYTMMCVHKDGVYIITER